MVLACSVKVGFADGRSCFPWRSAPDRVRIQVQLKVKGRRTFSTLSLPKCRRLIHCELKNELSKVRKHSRYLEGSLQSNGGSISAYELKVVPDLWRYSAEKYGDRTALLDPLHDPPTTMTYKMIEQEILAFSEGMRTVGLAPDEKIALFADNSSRWLIADQGIMAMGGVNVVRGSRSSVEELLQIYNHSDCVALVVDNAEFFNKIAKSFKSNASIKFLILLWGDKENLSSAQLGEKSSTLCYDEIIRLGKESLNNFLDSPATLKQFNYEEIASEDVCTIVYTSGTTGNPKGVMLSHKNLIHQINFIKDAIAADPGDKYLSMLPPWHIYERTCEYFMFSRGTELMYTSVKYLKDDLTRYQPHYFVSVPLVYESLYSGIQKRLMSSAVLKIVASLFLRISATYMELKRVHKGVYLTNDSKLPSYFWVFIEWLWAKVISAVLLPLHIIATKLIYEKIRASIGIQKAGISGGGSLPHHIDVFFEAIGIKLQNGYGMTETSPVIAVRHHSHNVIGSVGCPLRQTQVKIVDATTGEALPSGSKGIIKVNGPLVMKGYYKNQSATNDALDREGWLNTGDLGWIAPSHSAGRSRNCGGLLVIEGRAKDTIVLSTGENVEPLPLEEAVMQSDLINQVVVFGQDQRRIGAIVVPNRENCLVVAKNLSLVEANSDELDKAEISKLMREEVSKWTEGSSVKIGPILVADEPFTMESGLLTATMKVQRTKVFDLYKEQIANLYQKEKV